MKVRKRSIKKIRKYKKKQIWLRRRKIKLILIEYFNKSNSDVINDWIKFIEPMIEKE